MEAQVFATPRGIWTIYPYHARSGSILTPEKQQLQGAAIKEHLSQADFVAVLALTIGPALEEEVHKQFSAGNYSAALLLDAAGTTAVEAAADQLTELIRQDAAKKGYCITSRFSPGYGDWDIRIQPTIATIAHAEEIELTVTDSCMLLPRKSITAIIGLQSANPQTAVKEVSCQYPDCKNCSQHTCLIKK